MPNAHAVAELSEIAASSAPLAERAQGLLQELEHRLPVEASWLALCDPQSDVWSTLGSTGLDASVLDYLDQPSVAQEIHLAGLDHNQPPVSLAELPLAPDELPTWAECLLPAGFLEGLGVPLFEPGGPYLGMLTLLFSSADPPAPRLRDRLARLAPLIARTVSPMRSLLATARLVEGATSAVVLRRDGTCGPLQGLAGHALLTDDSPVVAIARAGLLAGQVYRSFLWPTSDGEGATAHLRVTVLGAAGAPAYLLGTLLMTPDADCRGLTPRELQVLGQLVEGLSNQQIAKTLGVAPRTVAAHMEHLLAKLDAPSRTAAAVRAEREGCYVPPPPQGVQGRRA